MHVNTVHGSTHMLHVESNPILFELLFLHEVLLS